MVRDSGGAVVPDAKISVKYLDRGTETVVTTSAQGEYVASPVKIGRYRVTAEKAGFKKTVVGPITVNIQEHPEVDILLIEPTRDDMRMFGYNIMRMSARKVVAEDGYRSVVQSVRRNRASYERVLLRHGIRLDLAVGANVGELVGDERKIKQILLNLLSNAVKFTPEGGHVEVRAERASGTVEVSVSDTGIGIAAEDQEAIFDEFRQVGTADKKVEGTGLGLALARKFVELHGGRIWVKSQVGQGSAFTFTLPVH